MNTSSAKSYAAQTAASALAPFAIARREPGPTDVAMEILFCGVCHSDLHQARNEWHNTTYPCVPGHEIIGRVTHGGERAPALRRHHHLCATAPLESRPRPENRHRRSRWTRPHGRKVGAGPGRP